MRDVATRIRSAAEDPQTDLNWHYDDVLEAADALEAWRALALRWSKIAARLLDSDDKEMYAWASGDEYDTALVELNRLARMQYKHPPLT